jgi:hypothetical protein
LKRTTWVSVPDLNVTLLIVGNDAIFEEPGFAQEEESRKLEDVTEFFCCDFITQSVGNFGSSGKRILLPKSDEQLLKTC